MLVTIMRYATLLDVVVKESDKTRWMSRASFLTYGKMREDCTCKVLCGGYQIEDGA
jgi:hypothetical protein